MILSLCSNTSAPTGLTFPAAPFINKLQRIGILGMEVPFYFRSRGDGEVAAGIWQRFVLFMQVGRVNKVDIKMQ